MVWDSKVIIELVSDTKNTNPDDRKFELSRDRNLVIVGRGSAKEGSSGVKDRQPATDNAYFDSPIISREHAKLSLSADSRRVDITDCASMHGTTLNGLRLTPNQATPVASGDVIVIGAKMCHGHRETLSRAFTAKITWEPYICRPSPATREDSVVEVTAREISKVSESNPCLTNRARDSRTFEVPEDDSEASIYDGSFSDEYDWADDEDLYVVKAVSVAENSSSTHEPSSPLSADNEKRSSQYLTASVEERPGSSVDNPVTIDELPANITSCLKNINESLAIPSSKEPENLDSVIVRHRGPVLHLRSSLSPPLSIASDSEPGSPLSHWPSLERVDGSPQDIVSAATTTVVSGEKDSSVDLLSCRGNDPLKQYYNSEDKFREASKPSQDNLSVLANSRELEDSSQSTKQVMEPSLEDSGPGSAQIWRNAGSILNSDGSIQLDFPNTSTSDEAGKVERAVQLPTGNDPLGNELRSKSISNPFPIQKHRSESGLLDLSPRTLQDCGLHLNGTSNSDLRDISPIDPWCEAVNVPFPSSDRYMYPTLMADYCDLRQRFTSAESNKNLDGLAVEAYNSLPPLSSKSGPKRSVVSTALPTGTPPKWMDAVRWTKPGEPVLHSEKSLNEWMPDSTIHGSLSSPGSSANANPKKDSSTRLTYQHPPDPSISDNCSRTHKSNPTAQSSTTEVYDPPGVQRTPLRLGQGAVPSAIVKLGVHEIAEPSSRKRKANLISSEEQNLPKDTRVPVSQLLREQSSMPSEPKAVAIENATEIAGGAEVENVASLTLSFPSQTKTQYEKSDSAPPAKKVRQAQPSSTLPFLVGTLVGGIGVLGALISLPESLF